jgi:hypothetical protein
MVRLEGLGQVEKKLKDLVRIQTRDLPLRYLLRLNKLETALNNVNESQVR